MRRIHALTFARLRTGLAFVMLIQIAGPVGASVVASVTASTEPSVGTPLDGDPVERRPPGRSGRPSFPRVARALRFAAWA